MNILHIGKFYPPYRGGMETYLCDLAKAQVKQGHQVKVWVHNHDYGWLFSKTTESIVDGVQVVRQSSLKPIFFTPLMWRFGRRINQILDEFKPDAIHLHSPNPSLFWLLLHRRALKLPCVLRWHADMVTEHSSRLLRWIYALIRPVENSLLKHVDQVMVSSPNYIQGSKQLQRNREKVQVLPLGLDTTQIPEVGSQADSDCWPEAQFRLYHLGRLTFYKDQQLLLQAMARLDQAFLNLAGDGQLADKLAAQVTTLGLEEQVALLGGVSWQQANGLYASCDVFCLPSNDRAESFGVVLLEAMYHDCIIVVADTPGSGMSWLAENYNKGFVFKAGDVADFVRVIEHIRKNHEAIKQLPRQFEYPIEAVAQSLESSYHSLLNE